MSVELGPAIPGPSALGGSPRRFVYLARTARDFTISQMNIQFYLPNAAPDQPPAQTAVLTLRGDSVIAEISSRGQNQTQRLKTEAGALMPITLPLSCLADVTVALRSLRSTSVSLE